MFFWAGAWLIALMGLLIHLLRQPMNRASDLYGPSMIFSLLLFSVPPALGQMRMSA